MTKYFLAQGSVYVALRGLGVQPLGYRLLGNCPRLDINLGLSGTSRETRGASNALLRTTGSLPTFSMDIDAVEQDNLSLLLHGTNTVVASGSVSTTVTARKGMMVPLPHINLTSFTDVRSAGNVAYPTSAYTVDLAAGHIVFSSISGITEGETVTVNYVQGGHISTGAYTNKPQFMALRFAGINTAESNAPVVVDLFKIKFDPMDDLPLINDNFLSLKTQGKIHCDDAVFSATPEGKFLRIRQTL